MELTDKIETALDTVRPFLVADGGNVKVIELTEDNVLRVEFVGTCGSCTMSSMTFRAGIEDAIRRMVPEVIRVEAVNFAIDY